MAIAADDPTVDAFIPGNSPPREPPRPESDLGEGGGVKRPPERSHFSMDSDDEEQQGSRTRTILSRLSRKSKVGRSSAAVPSLSSMPTRPPLYEQATAGDSRPGPKPIQRGSSPVPGRHAPSAAPSSDSQLHDGGEVDLDDFASMRQGDSND